MNAIVLNKRGQYGYGTMPIPTPGPGQILVKLEACTINPSDLFMMQGQYNIKHTYPFVPGWEGSGQVVAAGPGTLTQWYLGKRVACMKQLEVIEYKFGGSFADYMVTDIKSVIPLPDDVDFEQGASFFINPMTALGMLKRAKKLGADSIILTAGSSQIGRMIIRLCPSYGITPIVTVRRSE